MRVLLQRVTAGSVEIEGTCVGQIGLGVVLLVGIGHHDTEATVHKMAGKIVALRIFNDDHNRFNDNLMDVRGGALVISQFTLYADMRKGRRPSFSEAAQPDMAKPFIDQFARELESLGVQAVATGEFGAHMAVKIHNDGPVTIWLDSADWTGQ